LRKKTKSWWLLLKGEEEGAQGNRVGKAVLLPMGELIKISLTGAIPAVIPEGKRRQPREHSCKARS